MIKLLNLYFIKFLYNIGWGLKRPQGDFVNYAAFCNKNLWTDKISCFLSNCEISHSKLLFKELVRDCFIITLC